MKIKLVYIAIILFIIWSMYRGNTVLFKNKELNENFVSGRIERFTPQKKNLRQTVNDIYDQFYVTLYDKLFGSKIRVEYEFMSVFNKFIKTWRADNIHILDVGCGTGHILRLAKSNKLTADGMDISKHMLNRAAEVAPGSHLIKGDYNDISSFPEEKYSHIFCMFFTIYYSNDISNVFKNFNWTLKNDGMIFLHVVDSEKFDPILEASSRLIPFYDPQKYAKVRKTDTSITFNNLKYKSTWDFDNKEDIKFRENFILNDGKIIQNIHHFNIPKEKSLLKIANNNGFKLVKIIDMSITNHPFNYIYCLRKEKGKNTEDE